MALMDAEDSILLRKAFPSQMQRIVFLLNFFDSTSGKKMDKLLQSMKKDVVLNEERIPFDVDQFMRILQRDYMPSKGANITCIPVFFAFSKPVRHNIILFINQSFQRSERSESCSCFFKFLHANSARLDDWEKLFLHPSKFPEGEVRSNHPNLPFTDQDSSNISTALSERCLQKLYNIAERVKCKQHFSITLVPTIYLPDNCNDENNEKTCCTSQEAMTLTIMQDASMCTDYDPEEVSTSINHVVPMDGIDQLLTGSQENKIAEIKEELHSLRNPEYLGCCHKVITIFNECQSDHVDGICEQLEFNLLPEEIVCSFMLEICKQNILSISTTDLILKHTALSRLNQLASPISRCLFGCLVEMLKVNQRSVVSGVLHPLITATSFSSFQADVIKKLVKDKDITGEGISMFFIRCFEEERAMAITEEFISIIEIMLNMKPNLVQSCVKRMLHGFESNSSVLNKSVKLMKVVITLIKTYPQHMSSEKLLLQNIVNQNITFIKKSALNLISKLS